MKKTIARSRYSRALIVPLVLTVGMVLTLLSVSATYAGTNDPTPIRVFGPEYYLQPSSSGLKSARNVIVTKGDPAGDNPCQQDVYIARVYFTNTEGLMVKAFPPTVVTPDEIYIWAFVCGFHGGAVVYQAEYKYALPMDPTSRNPLGAWESAQGIEINEDYDADSFLDDNNVSYGYTLTYSSNPLAASHMTHQVEIYRDGANEILVANNFSTIISRLPDPLVIGPPLNKTFDNVAVATHGSYGRHGGEVRFLAQGVGIVQRFTNITSDDPVYNSQTRFDAIYYRIDGVSEGSLAGTPFAGGVSDGLWFTE